MAEFCLDCFNKINETNYSEDKYILSDDLDFCEGCGEWKHVVVMERDESFDLLKFVYFTLPAEIICKTIYFLWRILILPYSIYNYKKQKKKINNTNSHYESK